MNTSLIIGTSKRVRQVHRAVLPKEMVSNILKYSTWTAWMPILCLGALGVVVVQPLLGRVNEGGGFEGKLEYFEQ